MKRVLFTYSLFLFVSNIIFSAPIDTGMREWFQPNSVRFNARMYGDEFLMRFTTDDNYEIIEGIGRWYFYATLNEN